MTLPLQGLGLLLLTPALLGLSEIECPRVASAHERLLAGSFEVEREFRISINGDLKRRELTRLEQTNGELEVTVIEEEVLSKNVVLDSDSGDPALDIGFACERADLLDETRVALSSEDGTETVVFALDETRGTLRPVEWRLQTTERFLFKKLVIEGRALYDGFAWRDTAPGWP